MTGLLGTFVSVMFIWLILKIYILTIIAYLNNDSIFVFVDDMVNFIDLITFKFEFSVTLLGFMGPYYCRALGFLLKFLRIWFSIALVLLIYVIKFHREIITIEYLRMRLLALAFPYFFWVCENLICIYKFCCDIVFWGYHSILQRHCSFIVTLDCFVYVFSSLVQSSLCKSPRICGSLSSIKLFAHTKPRGLLIVVEKASRLSFLFLRLLKIS